MAVTARLEMYEWSYKWVLNYQAYYHALYLKTTQEVLYQMTKATYCKSSQFTDYWQSINSKNFDRQDIKITWPRINGGPQTFPTSLMSPRVDVRTYLDDAATVTTEAINTSGFDDDMKPYAEKTAWSPVRFNSAGDTFGHQSFAKYRYYLTGADSNSRYRVKVTVNPSTTESRSGGFRNAVKRQLPLGDVKINGIAQSATGVNLDGIVGPPNYLTISTVHQVVFYNSISLAVIGPS